MAQISYVSRDEVPVQRGPLGEVMEETIRHLREAIKTGQAIRVDLEKFERRATFSRRYNHAAKRLGVRAVFGSGPIRTVINRKGQQERESGVLYVLVQFPPAGNAAVSVPSPEVLPTPMPIHEPALVATPALEAPPPRREEPTRPPQPPGTQATGWDARVPRRPDPDPNPPPTLGPSKLPAPETNKLGRKAPGVWERG